MKHPHQRRSVTPPPAPPRPAQQPTGAPVPSESRPGEGPIRRYPAAQAPPLGPAVRCWVLMPPCSHVAPVTPMGSGLSKPASRESTPMGPVEGTPERSASRAQRTTPVGYRCSFGCLHPLCLWKPAHVGTCSASCCKPPSYQTRSSTFPWQQVCPPRQRGPRRCRYQKTRRHPHRPSCAPPPTLERVRQAQGETRTNLHSAKPPPR